MLIHFTEHGKPIGQDVIGSSINFRLLLSAKPRYSKPNSFFERNATNHHRKGSNNDTGLNVLTGIAHFGSNPLPF